MKKIFIIMLATFTCFGAKADEGMWLPFLIGSQNIDEMKAMGFELSAEQVYDINNSSLKDAIVNLGGGFCTGEIISDKGLLLTNHHCAYSFIQSHSTVENDILTDGFWAKDYGEELMNEGLFVQFLVRIEDVTKTVLANVEQGMDEASREKVISTAIDSLKKATKGETHYDISVKPFFEGNEYYLFVYETYRDVRLVGAPPESVGKFGGDTDNWMWPRHTGDFSLFRVYMSPEGKPAEYSPDNVPLKPRHYLPVSMEGVKEGDFAMIMGYPGSTDRYLTSFGVENAIEVKNPTIVEIRDLRLKLMKEDMDADKGIRLKYASKHARVANYWKYFIGQTKGLKNLDVHSKKVQIEKDFMDWVNQSAERKEKYGEALSLIEEAYTEINTITAAKYYGREAGLAPELITFAYRFRGLEKLLSAEEVNEEKVSNELEKLKKTSEKHFKNYNKTTDQKILTGLYSLWNEKIEESLKADVLEVAYQAESTEESLLPEYTTSEAGNFSLFADYVYSNSMFCSQEKAEAFLQDPDIKALTSDPGYIVMSSVLKKYRALSGKEGASLENLNKGNRLFVAGLREMNTDKKYYPNANSTMRLTYGQVLSYEARDAVNYNYKTTQKGILQKEDNTNPEFVVPGKLHSLLSEKDFGQYAEENNLVVGFLTNTDITGGNSGSPVINAKGHLIGTAFDGNWEAMSGDIAFEPELQRTISVDIRYTLFIIDKYAEARHLIDEMTLVWSEKPTKKKKKRSNRAK